MLVGELFFLFAENLDNSNVIIILFNLVGLRGMENCIIDFIIKFDIKNEQTRDSKREEREKV